MTDIYATRNFPNLESFETGYKDGKLGEVCDSTRAVRRMYSFGCEETYLEAYICGALDRSRLLSDWTKYLRGA